jgi:hypothetical protein
MISQLRGDPVGLHLKIKVSGLVKHLIDARHLHKRVVLPLLEGNSEHEVAALVLRHLDLQSAVDGLHH